MAEINKRNLVDETAAVYAANTLANEPTPFFSTGMPAKIIRASIANTNLLSKDGDLFVGTGGTYTETIDGIEYTYAKIAKKNQSKLFVDGLDNTAKNVGLAANVGKFIDDRLHISNSTAEGVDSIALGHDAKTTNDQAAAIGYMTEAAGRSIAMGASATAKGVGSIALGSGATVTAAAAIQLGPGTNSTTISFQVGGHQMLDLMTGKIPLGRINQVDQTKYQNAFALGGTAKATYDTVYGVNSSTGGGAYGTAIGADACALNRGDTAIGYAAYCKGSGNVAIGKQASVGLVDNTFGVTESVAIGGGAIVSNKNGTLRKAIQLGYGTNESGGLKVFDWQLLDSQGTIPIDRMPTLQYQHNLTLSAKSQGQLLFYLSLSIITDDKKSLSNAYNEQQAVTFLNNLAKTLSENGYKDSGEFRCSCTGYDVVNASQMMWLSGNGSTIKYYYVQNNSIQSRTLSIGSSHTGIYVDDKVIAGFKL